MTARSFTLTSAEQQRIDRIDQLVVLGGGGVAELLAAIGDSSWTVRRAAVAALVSLGDEAVPALQAWLSTVRSSEHAIAAAVDTLAGSLGASATGAAIAMLSNPRPEVAADGAAILGRRHAVEAIDPLIAQLRHSDDNVAVSTIEALGAIGPSVRAIDALIGVLEQRSFFRAFPALQVLARTGDPRGVQPIALLLEDPLFRAEAIRALGQTGSALAIAPLTALLSDPDAVRIVAIALAQLIARAEWSGAGALVAAALHAEHVATALVAAMTGADHGERVAIATVLGRTGSPTAVPVLVALLEDEALRATAIAAIKALTRDHEVALLDALGDDAATLVAVLPLVASMHDAARVRALLEDGDGEVRARACEALARLGDVSAVPKLFAALADKNPRVALAATGAIQALQTSETATRTFAALVDPQPSVRRQALRIVAYLGFADAFEPVHTTTNDPDRRVAELAIAALGTLADPRVDPLLAELARSPDAGLRATAIRAWTHRDTAAPHLEAALADDDAWVRYYACQGLGRLGRSQATTLLLARLGDAMPHVRVAAIEALARFETPAAWQALTSAVRSSDPDERRAALVGLGQEARAAAVPILVEAAHSADLATRLIAISGLARQPGARAISELAHAARDADPALRDAAISLLGERDDATPALIALALDARDPAIDAALSRPIRVTAIEDALRDADDHAAVTLAAALARIPAVPTLFAALAMDNPAARRAAASSLVAIAAYGANDRIAKLASDDPDPDVRRFCSALRVS